MRRTIRAIRLFLPAFALLLATGCTTMSEAQREAREYGRIDYRNKFIEYRDRCLANGGRIYVQGHGGTLDRDGVPRTRVHYDCA